MKQKKILTIGLALFLLFVSSMAFADKVVIGQYCFKMDTFADKWYWIIDDMGGGAYQVTGFDPANGAAMNGGGRKIDGHLMITLTAANTSANIWGEFGIDIDLTSLTGTCDLIWYNAGVPFAIYEDLTFHNESCAALSAPQGQFATGALD